jgi:amidase
MTSHESNKSPRIDNYHVSRRSFLSTTAAGSAALLTGGLAALFKDSAVGRSSFPFVEATISQLQAAMTNGQLTSRDLVLGYLNRIQSLNPTLHAVIETNPNAVSIATSLDNERKAGHVRGPLHGIPLLVKDNIATLDNLQTTAGSLALYNSQVPADSPLIQRLRAAGAIILGKSNLGEWANFRGSDIVYPLAVGWSARGGDTKNAYDLSYTSWGSSSGSGAGAAASLCAAAVGTETDGSITGPSAVENLFGLKPTVGLISQDGIVPISHQQDTAGPMARSVTDVAILLGVMQSPFGSVIGHSLPSDYTQFLDPHAFAGKRIGRDTPFFDNYAFFGSGIPGDDETVAFANHALDVMASLGATIVDTNTLFPATSISDTEAAFLNIANDEFTALLFEFKVQIAQYLQTLGHTDMRTLADLIAFNNSHCVQELVYYGQDIFEAAQMTSGDLTDPTYLAARNNATGSARAGIDGALQRDNLDAIVAPHLTNSTEPAVAGYPNFSMPVGIRASGRPAGMLMYSTFLHEPQLIGFAYALEQALKARKQPQFLGAIIPIPNAGLCTQPHQPQGKEHLPHSRIF